LVFLKKIEVVAKSPLTEGGVNSYLNFILHFSNSRGQFS